MAEPTLARAALEAAGYRCYGLQGGPLETGSHLWQRKEGDVALNVFEWPPLPDLLDRWTYELDVYYHDDRDAFRAKLYSYSPEVFAARLPELERRALAVVRAVRENP